MTMMRAKEIVVRVSRIKAGVLNGWCNSSNKQYHGSVACCATFWQPNRHGGPKYGKELTFLEELDFARKHGRQFFKEEFKLFGKEIMDQLAGDHSMPLPGDTEIVWKFDDTALLDKFVVACDQDYNHGYSECQLNINDRKKALFTGTINTQVPKDGKQHRAGYCNFTTLRARKSFKRDSFLDWHGYTHLLLRLRGDGRSYMLNLHCEGYFDIHWQDMYNYVLYTRGGPYWQMAKIPFSKFYMSSMGRIQDKQYAIPLTRITHFGITCAKVPGPFQLEIDYVGLHLDAKHDEEFAYEMYQAPKYTVGV